MSDYPKVQSMRLVLEVTTSDARVFRGATNAVGLDSICEYEDARVFKVLDAVARMGDPSSADTELTDKDMVHLLFRKLTELQLPSSCTVLPWDRGPCGDTPTTLLELLRNRLLKNLEEGYSQENHEEVERRKRSAYTWGLRMQAAIDQAGDTETLRDV